MENATPPPSTPPPVQPLPSPPPPNPNTHRQWDMWCHITALAGLVIPFGNLIGPLIIWQMKRSEFPSVDEHGKESLNFQLSVLIYQLAGAVIALSSLVLCLGFLLIPLFAVLFGVIYLGSIILAVIAGIKANDGILYRYPLNLRLVK